MATYEEEYRRLFPMVERICDFSLLGKRIIVKGKENFVETGPNIIVGNHIGTFKDIATILKIVPRPVFFTANRLIFNTKDFSALISHHLRHHLKSLGAVADLLLKPFKMYFVNYISMNVSKAGTIPVDLSGSRRLAIDKCQRHLSNERAIIALQGRGRIEKHQPNPYVSSFRKGVSVLAYNLFKKEGITVPVTPLAFFGTQIPFLVPGKIKVNVGKSMYVTDYLLEEVSETLENFRAALEGRVKALLLEVIRT